jgi:DNA modification methylase
MNYQLHQGNNAEVLKQYPDSHFDAIITDPPYGIEFLGKDWDNHTGTVETWQECLRVLKPGGHLLAFSAARTYHHLATNIESVGFEIRDQLMWIYSSGFPKAQDIGKSIDKRGQKNNWHGWKTALKPGHEPIVMARKPMKGSTIDNVLQHGVGALNIDSSRIPYEDSDTPQAGDRTASFSFGNKETQSGGDGSPEFEANPKGRYPSNVMGDIPDYQKYFYCPKVSRRERHVGFEQSGIPNTVKMLEQMGGYYCDKNGNKTTSDQHTNLAYIPNIGVIQSHGVSNEYGKWCKKKEDPLSHIPTNSDGMMSRDAKGQLVNNYTANKSAVGNNHPTVKPVALMRYLIQLVTPANSTVLDPFMGSGSTGMAAVELGHRFVGIDLDANYVAIADKRILGWCAKSDDNSTFDKLFD